MFGVFLQNGFCASALSACWHAVLNVRPLLDAQKIVHLLQGGHGIERPYPRGAYPFIFVTVSLRLTGR